MLVQLLSKASKQLKEHCALLSSEEKQSLYSKVLNEVKSTPRDSRGGINQLKKLSKVAIAIEETIDSKLLEKFNDGHPLREINIAYAFGEDTNYLFSLSDSSELYDLKEDSRECDLSPSLTVVFFFNKPKVKKRGFKNKEVEYLNRIEYNY